MDDPLSVQGNKTQKVENEINNEQTNQGSQMDGMFSGPEFGPIKLRDSQSGTLLHHFMILAELHDRLAPPIIIEACSDDPNHSAKEKKCKHARIC